MNHKLCRTRQGVSSSLSKAHTKQPLMIYQAKAKSIRLEKPAAVEAEIFIASVHGALLSVRAHGEPKMFGEIIRPVLGRLAKK
jgi:hypothetical protein